ncbi:MAG TPA: PepSY-associated TM helix domain-containing protein [Hanamia sp.]
MTPKKIIHKLHLWLGFGSGIIIVFLGITGCMLAFEREIETMQSFRYVAPQKKSFVEPSVLKETATKLLPGKILHSVVYGTKKDAAQMLFYNGLEYYYVIFMNPYAGKVLKVKNMNKDFFRIIINGHYYLWLPNIGQPVVTTATLIFLITLITGLVLWWPRNNAAKKQRFKIKWNARWRRRNYDLHNVLGFYMTWIAIFLALSGMVMGFQWFAKSVYWATSSGKSLTGYYEPASQKPASATTPFSAEDKVWGIMQNSYKNAETIEVHYASSDSSPIVADANPDASTLWKTDYRYFDQYTLKEMPVTDFYGRFGEASVADKIQRMNYDIHTGEILGLPGKILAFFASLIAASLPITGFYIWWGRKRKRKRQNLFTQTSIGSFAVYENYNEIKL